MIPHRSDGGEHRQNEARAGRLDTERRGEIGTSTESHRFGHEQPAAVWRFL